MLVVSVTTVRSTPYDVHVMQWHVGWLIRSIHGHEKGRFEEIDAMVLFRSGLCLCQGLDLI